jgi:hypothetical protein
MDINKRVCLKADYLLEKIDDEVTVYHPSLATSLYMNDSSAVIWELCDGQRRISDIIEILQEAYPENDTHIKNDVIRIISQLVEHDIASLSD